MYVLYNINSGLQLGTVEEKTNTDEHRCTLIKLYFMQTISAISKLINRLYKEVI